MPILTTLFLVIVAVGIVASIEEQAWITLAWQLTSALWSMVAYALWRRTWPFW